MVRIRTCLASGVAVVGVSALVLTPAVPERAPVVAEQPVVALTAQVQSLPPPRVLVSPAQPVQLLDEQVNFHVGLAVDFIVTGAQLIARQLPVPGTLLQDIQNGTPLPVAVGRALQTLVEIELDAGRELVGFAAEYVSFQLNFLANLVSDVVALASSFVSGLAPTPAALAVAKPTTAPRSMDLTAASDDDIAVEGVSDAEVSTTTRANAEQPKKPKTAVAADDSVSAANVTAQGGVRSTSTTDPDEAAVPARARDRASRSDEASAAEQPHKADAKKAGGKTDGSAGADSAGDSDD
jgi:hypothetical protein